MADLDREPDRLPDGGEADGVKPDAGDDAFAERLAAPLRAAELPDPMFRARVLAAIRADLAEAPTTSDTPADAPVMLPLARAADRAARDSREAVGSAGAAPARGWWQRRVAVGIVPLAGLALAACLAIVVLARGGTTPAGADAAAPPSLAAAPAAGPAAPAAPAAVDTVHLVRFVFVAPEARSVALVGDFNAWDASAVQLVRERDAGVWTATVSLPAGRHEYAFMIDGERWSADPNAAASMADEFGVESSILTVASPAEPTRRS